MLPFQGIHDHTLDAKNRLTVPARSRPQLSEGVTVAMGFEHCLQVWPAQDYARVAEQALANLNPFSSRTRELKRHLYGNATTSDLDGAGRIGIPREYLQHAGITKDVKVIGAGEYLEVWDRDTWNAQQTDLISRAADHIESIGHPA